MTTFDLFVALGLLMLVDKERRPAAFIGMLLVSAVFALLRWARLLSSASPSKPSIGLSVRLQSWLSPSLTSCGVCVGFAAVFPAYAPMKAESAAFNPDNWRSTLSRSFFNCFTIPGTFAISPPRGLGTARSMVTSEKVTSKLWITSLWEHCYTFNCKRLEMSNALCSLSTRVFEPRVFTAHSTPASQESR